MSTSRGARVTSVASRPWLALTALVLVAVNLRLATASVPPLLPQIRDDFGVSSATAGLVTAIPVLCFGLFAPAAAWLGRRLGLEGLVVAALAALAAGIAVRSAAGLVTLLLGTVVIGAAIAAGNVVVPALVKRDFAESVGWMTGVYTTVLMAGAAGAAAVTAALASTGRIGWRGALAVWAMPAVLGLAAWVLRRHRRRQVVALQPPDVRRTGVWRVPLAWQLVAYMATQSIVFYAMLTWLPALLQDDGVTVRDAGLAVAAYNFVGIACSLTLPPLAARLRSQRMLAASPCALWMVALVGLLTAPDLYPLWTVLAGLAQGAGLSMAMTLIPMRAASAEVARDLAGMVLTVGYLLSAAGPLVVGALRDHSGGWNAPIAFLLVVTLAMTTAALACGRPEQIAA